MHEINNSETKNYIKDIVLSMPEKPGCYQYLNEKAEIIYIGKAKNLKKRVSSYFNKDQHNNKTNVLVSKIRDIKYIVVKTEEDALLLENNLIKKYKPKYNVLLKDDKTYPSICITNELFPRVIKTRKVINNGNTYFGPYSHIATLNGLMDLIKNMYPIRTCNLKITEENIRTRKFRPCLEYQMKNCNAPCAGLQKHNDYLEGINEIKEILKGNTTDINKVLLDRMRKLAEEMKFEEAQQTKQKYMLLENYRSKSEVVVSSIDNVDVFSIEDDKQIAYINYLHVTKGCINQGFTFEYKKKLNESLSDLLAMGIIEMRSRYKNYANEVIIPFPLSIELQNVTFTVPQKGEKKKLLNLSTLNVKQYKADKIKQADKLNPEQRSIRLMNDIKQALALDKLPVHIECFDNSNISGKDAVAGCIVFKKCKPSRKEYRKYIIKSVEGPDDYASMREVVQRRYSRIIKEQGILPNLIITDGGRGQMKVVREVIEELGLKIPIAGLAKDSNHRTNELLYGFPPVVIGMKTDSSIFRFMNQIQNEVHRFAITYHREKRSKRQIESTLDDIKGIGEKTKTLLLRKFKSLKRIKEASFKDLSEEIGNAKAKKIIEALGNNTF